MTRVHNAVLAALGLFVGAVALTMPMRKAQEVPADGITTPIPLREWTTADAGMVLRAVQSALPEPAPGQKTRCEADLGEVELNGACWMKTDVPPPCPTGKLWKHEGKCWRPIPKTARTPTSGESRPIGVAEP